MNIVKATRIARIIGEIIAYGLVISGIVLINPLLVLIGIFTLFAARSEEYYLRLKTLSHGLTLKDLVMHEFDSLDANATAIDAASILMTNHAKYFIVMDNGKAVGTISRLQIIKSISEMTYNVKLKDLMKLNLEYLHGNTKVETLIEKLAGKEERLYPVMDRHHFLGVINFQHVVEYLLIHSASTQEYGRTKSLAGLV
jgi:predicted transcriptional regulator